MRDAIVFYDGDCGLCNYVVQFILKNERNEELSFCSLQSEFAQELLRQKGYNARKLNTLYFVLQSHVYTKTGAAIHLIRFLKPKWWLLMVFWFIPWFIRDLFYDFVARIRKKLIPNVCIIEKRNSTRFIA
jgi:predicted DCC family thiol-disulfide oxidoreductase YuxK